MPEASPAALSASRGPMVPELFEVLDRRQDTGDTWTLELRACSGNPFAFAPGQFTMLSAGGSGEVPISISGHPDHPERLVHTVREVGLATAAICAAEPGSGVGSARAVRPAVAGGAGRGRRCRDRGRGDRTRPAPTGVALDA